MNTPRRSRTRRSWLLASAVAVVAVAGTSPALAKKRPAEPPPAPQPPPRPTKLVAAAAEWPSGVINWHSYPTVTTAVRAVVRLTTVDDVPVPGRAVTVVRGNAYCIAYTDANGVGSCSTTGILTGGRVIRGWNAKFAGDAEYGPSSSTFLE